MNQNDPPSMIRMLDEFRSGTGLQYRRQSSTFLVQPKPVASPFTSVERSKRPFDETLLNENDMLIKRSKTNDSPSDDSLYNSFGK